MAEPAYHHGNLRAALLAAGFELARRGGPARLLVRELAAAEGVSPSAVYRHFPDLAHLAAEVSRLAREALARAMRAAATAAAPRPTLDGPERAGPTPRIAAVRRFRAIGRAYLDFALAEPRLFDTAFMAASAPPSCADEPSAWDVLLESLDDLVATGAMPAARLPDAPIVAWSSVHGAAGLLVRQLAPDGVTPAQIRDSTLDGVLRALEIREPAALPAATPDAR
jgi:AcrR family transcriptional regulator